jgi:hypothetical protein
VRDALAALGNVEAMVRSRRGAPLDDEIAELRQGLAWIRDAFTEESTEEDQRDVRATLAAFAEERVRTVEAALDHDDDGKLAAAAADLDAAAGLLELIERASEGPLTEVSVATLAEQALHLAWTIRSHGAFGVHVRASDSDCSVSCDPHVVARVLAIAVTTVRDVTPAVVVRTHVEDDAGVIEVTAYTPNDAGSRVMQTRLAPRIAPTEAVFAAAARAAGIGLVIEEGRILLRCPRVV